MTAREIKENSIRNLITIITNAVKQKGGKIELEAVFNGTGSAHNDSRECWILEVFDYKHSNKNYETKSESGIYYHEDCCLDAPIEELGFYQLFEIAFQCEKMC